ncbi:MAG: alpha/beta hydrolase [Nostoc sp.]|uniref:alpha/beta fold hydrolase n=1 Tax=Nostoc sp. TaxID=1180 RepID=UPI002FF95625
MSTITTKDGTQIYYNDWGTGPTVILWHGWPLNADSWEIQALFLALRAIASSPTIAVGMADRVSPEMVTKWIPS